MKKFGILGASGSIGMRHAKNLQDLGYETVCYDPAILNGVSREDVFKDSDAIIIATPTECHIDDLYSAMATKKPVFCEKPIAEYPLDSFKELQMVGYNLRFHGCARVAKAWLDNDDIGTPMWANFTCGQYNEKYAKAGSGVILNWSHEIDLAFHLLGKGAVISGAVAHTKAGVDFIADISIRHGTNCLSSVHLDYVTQPEVRQFMICGDKGQIIVDLRGRHAWLRDKDGEIIDQFTDGKTFDDDYIEEIKAFAEGRYYEGCTGEQGLMTLNACLAAKGIAA